MPVLRTAEPNNYQPNNLTPNGVYLPSAPKNLASIIRTTYHFPFRKLEIKRRQSSDGLYEPNWQDISKYVTKWGNYELAIDAQRVNQFIFSGFTFNVKNDFGEFNPEYDAASLFYGYFTRYRTLVRLSAGYTDGSGTQYPSDAVQGIFIMDAEIDIAPKNKEVSVVCKSLISPFQETRATEIGGITASITASEIVEKIRDATDGSGNFLFRNFITSTAWDIQTTTTIVSGLGTTTALDSYSVWELINKLAEAENFIVTTTRSGGIVFGNRSPNNTDPQMSFYGAGYREPNVIKINSYKEATNKLYTHARFKFVEDDTVTSYVEVGTSTVVSPLSNVWKYGRRTYEFENNFFSDSATAEQVANAIVNEFFNLRSELSFDALFEPSLDILDRISFSHQEGSQGSQYVWDLWDWAADTTTSDGSRVLFWASETSASLGFINKEFKIISKKTDLDKFVTTFNVREVEN